MTRTFRPQAWPRHFSPRHRPRVLWTSGPRRIATAVRAEVAGLREYRRAVRALAAGNAS